MDMVVVETSKPSTLEAGTKNLSQIQGQLDVHRHRLGRAMEKTLSQTGLHLSHFDSFVFISLEVLFYVYFPFSMLGFFFLV